MSQIRDLNMLLSIIGDGKTIARINSEWPEAMKALVQLSREAPRKAHKGKMTLSVDVECNNGVATVSVECIIKLPKLPPERTTLWIEPATGFFTLEHPSQLQMFPRAVVDDKTIEGEVAGSAATTG